MIDQKTMKTVGLSLLASTIFLLLVQPILKFIGHWLPVLSSSFYDWLMASAVTEAAYGFRESSAIATYFFIKTMFIAITGASFASGYSALKEKNSKKTEEFPSTYEARDKYLAEKEQEIEELKKKMRALLKFGVWMMVVFTAIFLWETFSNLAISNMIATFNRRMTILAPYMTEAEEERLKSKWASMKKVQDYRSINEHLESLSIKEEIILPKTIFK